jgi:hypothetical protein
MGRDLIKLIKIFGFKSMILLGCELRGFLQFKNMSLNPGSDPLLVPGVRLAFGYQYFNIFSIKNVQLPSSILILGY